MINDKIKTFNIMNDYIKKLNNQKINIMKQTINENQNIIDMYKNTVSHLNNVINKAIKQRDKYIIENKLLEHNQHHIINIIKNN